MPLTPQEQAPLTACQKCKDRPCIKTGKICDEVEKLLKPLTIGRRNWQTIVDPRWFDTYTQEDKVLIRGKNNKGKEEALHVSRGKRNRPLYSEE
jgi:hypothetical protein